MNQLNYDSLRPNKKDTRQVLVKKLYEALRHLERRDKFYNRWSPMVLAIEDLIDEQALE